MKIQAGLNTWSSLLSAEALSSYISGKLTEIQCCKQRQIHRPAYDWLSAHLGEAGDADISMCFLSTSFYTSVYCLQLKDHILCFLITTAQLHSEHLPPVGCQGPALPPAETAFALLSSLHSLMHLNSLCCVLNDSDEQKSHRHQFIMSSVPYHC